MRVEDIMENNVVTVRPDATLREAALRMLRDDVGALPVVDVYGRIIGIITDRDIVLRAVASDVRASEVTVDSVLTGDVHTIGLKADVEQAAHTMAGHKVRRLPVTDRGRVVGIISLSDFSASGILSGTTSYALRMVTMPGKPHMC